LAGDGVKVGQYRLGRGEREGREEKAHCTQRTHKP
jgi:hypothetical protein